MADIPPLPEAVLGIKPFEQLTVTLDIASLQGGCSKYNCTGGQPVPHDVEICASVNLAAERARGCRS